MQQTLESGSQSRERWEAECVAAMLKRIRDLDREEARQLVHAAWSIERYRSLAPASAAERLLDNPAIRAGRR